MFLFYRHQLGSVPYLLVVAPYHVDEFNNIVLENENFHSFHKLKLLFCVMVAIPFVFTLLLALSAHHFN